MNKEKYYKALDIQDPLNMTASEKEKWDKLLSLSPTARGYVCKAKEQGVDILFCFSKENLYQRYSSHFDLLAVSEYLKLQPKKVILKGHEAHYYSEDDVKVLDEFMKKDKKEIAKIVSEQNSLKKYGVKSYKQTDTYRENISKVVKQTWQKQGYRERISTKVKSTYENASDEKKQQKRQHIKNAMQQANSQKATDIENFKKDFKEANNDELLCLTELANYLDICWSSLDVFEKRLGIQLEVFQKYNIKFIRKSDAEKAKDLLNSLSSYRSALENQVLSFIRSIYKGQIRSNDRRVLGNGKELDIYIPEKNLAIEFDGMYWHSDAPGTKAGEIPDKDIRKFAATRHLEKTKICEDKGIRLIHIFEDDWLLRDDIVKSILRVAIGQVDSRIFARKCTLEKLDTTTYRAFLEKNHLQGYSYADVRLGLFYEGELVECIGVNSAGTHSKLPELVRLCTKQNTQVVGGFGKLLKACNFQEIYSYIDRGVFAGKGYKAVGFTIDKVNAPTYFYVKGLERFPRYAFTRKRIETLFQKGQLSYWNPEETEEVNMYKNNFYRVWNCGTIKVRWVRP